MVLSDRDIEDAIKKKRLVFKPKINLSEQLGSNSIDLRLGNVFRIFDHSKYAFIDPFKKNIGEEITREVKKKNNETFIIQPGDFVLGSTIEYVEIPDDLVGSLEGRSSIGRLGIIVHSTAASIECGFRGKITLELANMGKMPVALRPGMRICALSFTQMTSPAKIPYYKKKGAKYIGQLDPGESKFDQEK
jgi:dCTP deaminase